MFGFRVMRGLLCCFRALIWLVEHYPQIVCGSAGMVALIMVCSQKVPAEVVIRLFHECVLSVFAIALWMRCRNHDATKCEPAKPCSVEAIEIDCQLSLQFGPRGL